MVTALVHTVTYVYTFMIKGRIPNNKDMLVHRVLAASSGGIVPQAYSHDVIPTKPHKQVCDSIQLDRFKKQ